MTRAEPETLNIASRRGYSAPTSLGMSRGIPGYPSGSPRGSAGEAGPMPPRPLHTRHPDGSVTWSHLSPRQAARTHQEFVDGAGALPAFANRPDHERLAAPHVAGGEQLGNRRAVVGRVGADIAARIELDTGLLDHAEPARPQEAHCQQDEIRLQREG